MPRSSPTHTVLMALATVSLWVMKHYLNVATELSVKDGILMRGSRILIPSALRLKMLDRIHTGHQGIVKCRERAR